LAVGDHRASYMDLVPVYRILGWSEQMNRQILTRRDWEEVFYALNLKLAEVEKGRYDEVPGDVNRPDSETARWAAHLRRIMRKIERAPTN
jgi:hypothetical protein